MSDDLRKNGRNARSLASVDHGEIGIEHLLAVVIDRDGCHTYSERSRGFVAVLGLDLRNERSIFIRCGGHAHLILQSSTTE